MSRTRSPLLAALLMFGLCSGLPACGLDGPIDQPAPPPEPSAILSKREADVVVHTGVVAEVNGATRTWTSVGDGQRRICLLSGHGVLDLDGKPVQVEDLKPGMTITAEGKDVDDFLLVLHAAVAPPPPEAGENTASGPSSADTPSGAATGATTGAAAPPAAPTPPPAQTTATPPTIPAASAP